MSKRSRRKGSGSPSGSLAKKPDQQIPVNTGNDPVPNGMVIAKMSSLSFSGPLPPPAILHEYDEVLERAAERIFKMAESQACHRQDLEKRVVKSDILKSYLGLTAGFVVAAIAITCGSLVAYNGQPWAGAAIGGAPVVGLVWAFLKGTNDRSAEREAKMTRMQQSRKA